MDSVPKKRMEDGLASVVYQPDGRSSWLHFSGAVLTGGGSRRMGFPKSRLVVEGETLLRRQLRLLREAGASELLASVNGRCPGSLEEGLSARIVPDRIADSGPLAGIEALLQASQYPWVAIVAVDLPRLTVPFLRNLLQRVTSTSGVIPVHGGRLEPLCAVYPRLAAAPATRLLELGRLEATGFASTGIREGWLHPWAIDGTPGGPLTNWNHPWDLVQNGRKPNLIQ